MWNKGLELKIRRRKVASFKIFVSSFNLKKALRIFFQQTLSFWKEKLWDLNFKKVRDFVQKSFEIWISTKLEILYRRALGFGFKINSLYDFKSFKIFLYNKMILFSVKWKVRTNILHYTTYHQPHLNKANVFR